VVNLSGGQGHISSDHPFESVPGERHSVNHSPHTRFSDIRGLGSTQKAMCLYPNGSFPRPCAYSSMTSGALKGHSVQWSELDHFL
jgi:hypothetical protein